MSHHESSDNGTDQSSAVLQSGELRDVAHNQSSPMIRAIMRFVVHRPGLWLGAALCGGMALGWWVKRR